MTDGRIVLEQATQLGLLGQVTEGWPHVEAHVTAKAICVMRPARGDAPRPGRDEPEEGHEGQLNID
ncbi:MAG: hypothetical protein U0790_03800 [Isosphaeraceae bacterium]